MDEARKKLRVCLICVVVAAAVILGLVYCLMDVGSETAVSDGTLVQTEKAERRS